MRKKNYREDYRKITLEDMLKSVVVTMLAGIGILAYGYFPRNLERDVNHISKSFETERALDRLDYEIELLKRQDELKNHFISDLNNGKKTLVNRVGYEMDKNIFSPELRENKMTGETSSADKYGYKIPGKYDLNEPDELTLARLVYAEVRSEYKNPEILKHKASSVVNRAEKKGIGIKGAIFEPNQYKALKDSNKSYFYNPSKYVEKSVIDKEAWEECFRAACEVLNGDKYETFYTLHQKNGEEDPKIKYKWAKNLKRIAKIPTKEGFYHFYVRE
ncbi:MAG: hypothetical protein QXI33_03600 [Candidatus Pacearchaeota archaeon]